AGGAYVPIDPDHPADRIALVLESAAPTVVLTRTVDEVSLPGQARVLQVDTVDLSGVASGPVSDAERLVPLRTEHPAYVIFTSGSTGRPKGVALPHAAVVNQMVWKQAEYGLGTQDAVLLKTAATFDLSVWEFWWALQTGARLVIARPDGHQDPGYLLDLMTRESVTTLHVVPSMLSMLLSDSESGFPESVSRVLAIGEALPAETAARFRAASGARLDNLYGPTEAAVSVTRYRTRETDTVTVPIGTPEWNTQVFVLDSRLHPVPVGVPGELYLAGAQLARGYFGRPDLTADRFVANPYAQGERMYRTGDIVRWNEEGNLEYLERADFQVKVRGFRIELGEIESALRARPGVTEAVVVARDDAPGGTQLVGYVVGEGLDGSEIRSAITGAVPSYMVPSVVMVLDAMPLSVNGKVERKALPAPEFVAKEYRAPSTEVEQTVATVIAEVLDLDRIGVDDNFFELGGNSLIATQVAARLGAALDTRVQVRVLFEEQTVEALAARLESEVGAGGRVELSARPRPERIPLSVAQQRLWFLGQLDPESSAYNIPAAVRLTGALDVEALRRAIGDVLERHEALRTVYPEFEGNGTQVILPVESVPVALEPVDVADGDLLGAVAQLFGTAFDLTAEVPLRVALYRLEADEHVLALVVHHIGADGWSTRLLVRDLMVAYAARHTGGAPGWGPLPVQYADYTLWQREMLGSEDDETSPISRQLGYWTQTLDGVPEVLELPTDRPRPAVASNRGAVHEFEIERDLHAAVEALARDHRVTTFMVVHAATAVLLARLTGTGDIAVGSPVAGRGEQALDDVVGMFVNTLVLRTAVDGAQSFTDVLDSVRGVDLAAFANADVPFERLVEALNPTRSRSHSPLFQVSLAFQNLGGSELELDGLRVAAVESDVVPARFDLEFAFADRYDEGGAAGIGARLTYATDLFDAATAARFAAALQQILQQVTADPALPVGDLAVLPESDAELMLEAWNATDAPVPAGTLVDLLTATAQGCSDAPAVTFDGVTST
ncbi:amino acid adenylation domain-containing protein, partial [Rhodococcus sp. NPDC003322]